MYIYMYVSVDVFLFEYLFDVSCNRQTNKHIIHSFFTSLLTMNGL